MADTTFLKVKEPHCQCSAECIATLEAEVKRLTEASEKRESHIQELLDDIERLTEERQWQPTSELDAGVEAHYDTYAVRRRKDGQWFKLPLPPLPEAEHDH